MRIDGIGGRADGPGTRALVSGCFDDASREAIFSHAAAKDAVPDTPPLDFCKDVGGTTITMDECGARLRKNADTACHVPHVVIAWVMTGHGACHEGPLLGRGSRLREPTDPPLIDN